MRTWLQEFRDFALRGNVVDMAVGIIIGAAFGTITKSLVSDIMMPPLGLLVGGVEFGDLFIVLKHGAEQGPYVTLADAQAAGAVTINYGLFINNVISFLLVALAVFIVVRIMNRMHRRKEETPPDAPATKECGFCYSTIPQRASRCPHCTSTLT